MRVGFVALFLLLSLSSKAAAQSTITRLVDFNTTNTLVDEFNPNKVSPQFTNVSTGGIGNTGAISVPLGSNELWATKQGYSVTGAGDVYTFSAFFKIAANSGYGGLGFIAGSPVGSLDGTGHPAKGIGMSFHGGGGSFVNNQSHTNVSWPPDLILGNWYKMIFKITAKGSNTYDLNFQIWNSDAAGNVGSLKTEKDLTNVVNNDLGQASIINIYFSAAGNRMSYIDDFQLELEGNAVIVSEGEPVVQTAENIQDITHESATSGGTVIDDQGSAVTARGVCWSTVASPTLSDACSTDGSGIGSFTSTLTGLDPDTEYYVRSYATNSVGTSYGAQRSFTTESDSGPTPTPTPSPSPTPTPSPAPEETPSPQTSHSGEGKRAAHMSVSSSCREQMPIGIADLFQIDRIGSRAKLHFTPVSGHTQRYHVIYGYQPNQAVFGLLAAMTSQDNTGVQSVEINDLNPRMSYWFAVAPVNGCSVGTWSNWLEARSGVSPSGVELLRIFYRWI